MAATEDAGMGDETPVGEKLERMAEALSRVDGHLVDGDVEAAVEAAREENEWLESSGCGLCQRLGIGLVGVTMWVRAMPNTTDDAEQRRIEAARDSLAAQSEQVLTELSQMGGSAGGSDGAV